MASNWAEAFEKLQSQDTLVQRRASAERASTRVETLRKGVVQVRVATRSSTALEIAEDGSSPQTGAQNRPALPARTPTLAEVVEKLRRGRARRGKKQPTPSWEEIEDELRRRQEALKARV